MKKILTIFCILLLLITKGFAQNTCTPFITNGLIAYYPFCGNANDVSGNGYNGTVYGATLTVDRFGNANSAYNFNGTSDYIEVLDAVPLRLANTDFTISIWFQYSSHVNDQGLLSKRTGQYQNGWDEIIAGGSLLQDSGGYVFYQESGGLDPRIWSQDVIPANNWQHIVVVYSLATQTIKLYHNGILENTKTNFPSPNPNINVNLLIGNNNSQPYFMLGQIDDVSIYNRALTSSEIIQLYECTLTAIISAGGPTTFCQGGNVALTANTGIGLTYTWKKNNATISGATSSTYSATTSGSYKVIVTNSLGCTKASNVISVTVNALPTITLTPSSANICPGNSVAITTSGTSKNFLWSPITGLNNASNSSVIANPVSTTTYTVTGTSNSGCTKTKTIKVTVACPKPTGLNTTNITAKDATTHWSAVACATGYKLQYRVKNTTTFTTINNITTTSKSFNGLNPSTQYQWKVVSKCPDGSYSTYTALQSFTTLNPKFIGDENDDEIITAFPNPFTNELSIHGTKENGVAIIFDVTGKEILRMKTLDAETKMYTQLLTPGFYLLNYSEKNKTTNIKVVKF